MGVTVNVNSPMTIVHKDSGGTSPVFPDVCKTPSPGGPIPIPYPNIAKSSDASQTATTAELPAIEAQCEDVHARLRELAANVRCPL